MYTLGGKWRERKRQRKLRRKAKEQQQVIIPDEAFYADPEYLPKFDEVKIQEELSSFYDPSSSEYARFKYSMGGNLKMYDDHIALSSPKRKIKKPSYSPFKHGTSYDHLKLESSTENTLEIFNESMDFAGKGAQLSGQGDDLDFGTSKLRASMENLDISDMPGKTLTGQNSRDSRKSLYKADSWNREFQKSDNQAQVLDDPKVDSRNRDYSPIRNETKVVERNEDYSRTEPKIDSRKRDYSPVRSTAQIVNDSMKGEVANPKIDSRNESFSPGGGEVKIVNHTETPKQAESKVESWKEDYSEQGGGDVKVLDSMSRYDRTLNYVNQQNRTLQNGDYNELDVALSELSSDVFTDSELPIPLPDSREWSNVRLENNFYPDSPTSEFAFSKTPCSSRKNSIESSLSEESASEKEISGKIRPLPQKIISIGSGKLNGHTNGTERTTSKGGPIQNGKFIPKKPGPSTIKLKVGSTNDMNHKPGGGKGKIAVKKTDHYKNAKSKVNSFGNIHHVPGGGHGKIQSNRITNYKNVEPRTDTHGIEAFSNLPVEFQEIARRLAKQDKDLRDYTSSGSSSGGRSRPRSRLSSRSSRGGSLSPTERSPTKSGSLTRHSGLSVNLSASSTSLASGTSPKKRRPVSRTPSLHSRPVTPSLSRTHPATYCTPYDSRSRPSSRPASRSTSPIRLRNDSPSRGRRSRNSSPARGKLSRNTSPSRDRQSRKSPGTQGKRSRDSSQERNRSRSKTPTRSSSRNRLTDSRSTTPVMDILSINNSRSVFQVIPIHR